MSGSGRRGPFRPGTGGRQPWIFGNDGPGAQRRSTADSDADAGIDADADADIDVDAEDEVDVAAPVDGARREAAPVDGARREAAPGDGTIDFSRHGKRVETDGSEAVTDEASAARADPAGSGLRPEGTQRPVEGSHSVEASRLGDATSSPSRPDASGRVLVELYTKPGCHLCDDARPIVQEVVAEQGAMLVEHDITVDDELMAKYGEYIPVVVVGGRQHTTWRVDRRMLTRAIKAAGRFKRKRR